MRSLKFARYALLAFIACYAAVMLLGVSPFRIDAEILWLVAIASMIGMIISSLGCVAIQLALIFAKRGATARV